MKTFLNRFWPQWLHPFTLAERKVRRKAKGKVIAGPFIGMKLASTSICSAFLPKLLGTYERELNPWIEEFCKGHPETIVNVGAADGYFAVGMALRCPGARIHAFEMELEGRELLREIAGKNGVAERVEIHGLCTSALLGNLLTQHPGALVIMDVEGAEAELLGPDLVSALASCRILVELHEFVAAGIGKEIASRFSATHVIREIQSQERCREDLPIRSILLDRWLLKHTREFRPTQMSWFDMAPVQAKSDLPSAAVITEDRAPCQ